MDITYLGHSAFKLRGRQASVVTDPYESSVGFSMTRVAADIVTVSHAHGDHNNVAAVSGTARRQQPFLIQAPGEYEVSGISVFRIRSFHDNKQGVERRNNTVYLIHIDELVVAHVGDLGHILSDKQVEEIGEVDVLLVPVGGHYTLDPKQALEVVNQLQPSIVIPMHYNTDKHQQKTFSKVLGVDAFLAEGGFDSAKRLSKLTLTKSTLPSEMEVVVLQS